MNDTDAIERKAIELWDEARAKYQGPSSPMVEWPHLVSFMQDEYRDVARASLDLEAARSLIKWGGKSQ